jgi:hypothetical protein
MKKLILALLIAFGLGGAMVVSTTVTSFAGNDPAPSKP